MVKPQTRADGPRSVPALLHRNAKQFANAPAYREKEFGIWQSWTWAQTEAEVEALALGLLNLGVKEGDFIAIIGAQPALPLLVDGGGPDGGRRARAALPGR